MDNTKRYKNAVKDVLTVDEGELFPLVTLDKDSPLVTMDEKGRVLLLTLHAYPDYYVTGSELQLKHQCWTFTDKEFLSWFERNSKDVKDWQLRLHQVLGMPEHKKHSHISAMWVDPKDVLRPAYRTDVINSNSVDSFSDSQEATTSLQTEVYDASAIERAKDKACHPTVGMTSDEYKEWFNSNIIRSYFSDRDYPWTRIGYTYDWYHAISPDGNNGPNEYGLSEFLVPRQAKVKIEYTLTIDGFINKMTHDLQASKK